jgi:hypothetical protein
MDRAFKMSSVLIAVSLLAMASSTAEAARASKPREIVVVGSKLMETYANHFVEEARKALAVWVPRIESLRDLDRDDLAEAAYVRVSERLRHKSRVAMTHVRRVMRHTLDLLARHGGTPGHEQDTRDAAGRAKQSIREAKHDAIVTLEAL